METTPRTFSSKASSIDFEKLYSQAVLTMCWRVTPNSMDPTLAPNESYRQLIVATMELIPKYWDLNEPQEIVEQGVKVGGHRVYFLRRILSSHDAIQWYKTAIKNDFIFLDGNSDKRILFQPHQEEVFEHLSYPPFPNTVFLSDASIIPYCWQHAQTHHYWPAKRDEEMINYLSDAAISNWVNDRLCWNLNENLEYLGSLNLIVPNPYYAHSFCRLSPAKQNGSKEQVTISFDRTVADSGLSICFAERFNNGISALQQHPIDSEKITIPLEGRAEETGYIVFDKEGRIWDISPFSHFIRSISVKLDIVGAPRVFQCTDGTEQRTTHIEDSRLLTIGNEPDEIPEIALANKMVEMRRSRDQLKKPVSQFLFFKEAANAERKIRDIINSAEKSVLIVDPYFSQDLLKLFLAAVQSSKVTTTILCTRKGFERKESVADEAKLLQAEKELFESISGPISVYIADQDLLHDRFVIVDNKDVWLLGSSLNSIGRALSVIVRLDESSTRRKAIQTTNMIVDQATLLDEWIPMRGKKQRSCVLSAVIRLLRKFLGKGSQI